MESVVYHRVKYLSAAIIHATNANANDSHIDYHLQFWIVVELRIDRKLISTVLTVRRTGIIQSEFWGL